MELSITLPSLKWYACLSFALPLLFYIISLNGVFGSDYPTSILGTQYALWRYHSFSLGGPGNLLVQTVDKGLLNGRYYSAISPGFAILSLPFAALGFTLDGNTLNTLGHILLMDELFIGTAAALAILFVYKICRYYAPPLPSLLASLSLAFGTSVWPFATMIFINDVSLLFSVLSLYLVLKYAKESRRPAYLVIGGLALGVSLFVEYAAGLLLIPLLGYLMLTKTRWRDLLFFLFASSIGLILQLLCNYVAFDNPLLFPEQLKVGATGALLSRFDFSGLLQHAAYYIVSPYRGILLLSPIVILGFYGLGKMLQRSPTRLDSMLFISSFLVVLLPYSAWTDWSGGLVYGLRFLILGLPYLTIPISIALSETRSVFFRSTFLLLFMVSSFIQGMGALTTALSVSGNWLLYQPSALNISWLLEGKLDTWWVAMSRGVDASTFQLLSGLIFLSLWSALIYLVIRLGRLPPGSDSTDAKLKSTSAAE